MALAQRPVEGPEPARLGQAGIKPSQASPLGTQPSKNGNEPASTTTKAWSARPVDPVIESFQQTMKAFLEVQKTTMLAYLAGRGGKAVQSESAPSMTSQNGAVSANEALAVEASAAAPSHVEAPVDRSAANVGATSAAAQVPVDRATVTARLLATVQERTGYPLETLGLELDMEADLGIDSIKRVEILGKLRDEIPSLKGASDSAEAMDALAHARTSSAIVDKLISLNGSSSALEPHRPTPPTRTAVAHANGNGRHHATVTRRMIDVIEAPLPNEQSRILVGGRIVVAARDPGLARHRKLPGRAWSPCRNHRRYRSAR